MDLSIIIPVFNTKINYLKRCLDSVIEIEGIEYEVLLIDDGSDYDNYKDYKEILSDKKYNKIKYIRKENGGVSLSRNVGISEAKGTFIMFVDSDDSINASILQKKYFKISADLIIFDTFIIKKKNIKNVHFELNEEEGFINDISILIKNFIMRNTLHGPCAKLYRRDFLKKNKIYFNENIIQGEDAIFNQNIIEKVPKVYNSKKILYNYFYDYKTTDKRWKKKPNKMIDSLILNYEEEIKISNKLKEDYIKKIIENKYLNEIFTAYMILLEDYDKRDKKKSEILDKLFKFFQKINFSKNDVNGLNKIKYALIISKKWRTLKILSIFRKIYLDKIKKR